MRILGILAITALVAVGTATVASAQPRDRVTFGNDVVVHSGEVVRDVVTMGGDAVIEGKVTGDVVTMGGDLVVRNGGTVAGDMVTMGGEITSEPTTAGPGPDHSEPAPIVHEEGISLDDVTGWIGNLVSSFLSYCLLFVLGLVLMGAARERLDGLQIALVKQPLRAGAIGLLGLVGAVVGFVLLCITVIGIPVALVVAVGVPVATYVGMAAVASIVGAVLPIGALEGKPILQLAAGCLVLFLASLIPVAGGLFVAGAAVFGLGAVLVTRFKKAAQLDPENLGPYRTPAH